MVRRASAFAALVALMVLIATPGGASCAWASQMPHGCCAEPAPQPELQASSCCGDGVEQAPSPATTSDSFDCDCLHSPDSSKAVPAVGTPIVPAPDGLALQVYAVGSKQIPDHSVLRSSIDHVPRGGTTAPPLFLFDCAFLT